MVWTILAHRFQTASPGSGEWREYLGARETQTGFELAICGYELDENGDEGDELVADPSYEPVELTAFTLEHLKKALVDLGWSAGDLTSAMDAWAG
jgi:hypothetical protein